MKGEYKLMRTLVAIMLFLLCLSMVSVAQTTQHSVTLTCTPGTSNSPVTGFNFYRGTASGGPYTLQTATPQTTCSYKDTANLVEGQKYYYVATDINGGGESAQSTEASALIPFSKASPPSNLSANPQ